MIIFGGLFFLKVDMGGILGLTSNFDLTFRIIIRTIIIPSSALKWTLCLLLGFSAKEWLKLLLKFLFKKPLLSRHPWRWHVPAAGLTEERKGLQVHRDLSSGPGLFFFFFFFFVFLSFLQHMEVPRLGI